MIKYRSILYKHFFEAGFINVMDLRFDLNATKSYNIISNKLKKVNFLVWAGLRHAIPSHLHEFKLKADINTPLATLPSLIIKNNVFDIMMKKSKDYYALLKSKKAQYPSVSLVLKRDFNLTEDQLENVFLLPHTVCSEPYVKVFNTRSLTPYSIPIPNYTK